MHRSDSAACNCICQRQELDVEAMQFDCLFALKYPRSCMAFLEVVLGCIPALGPTLSSTFYASDNALLLRCALQSSAKVAFCRTCRTVWRGGLM